MKRIEQRLQELIPPSEEILIQAARYSLFPLGKCLRPLLTLETAELLGADPKSAIDPACAIEMIHTYSLIHDDLPCMDDDDMRRGRPSSHKVFGEAIALLAGDYLLTYAFEVIANAPLLTDTQKVHMIQVLAKYSGATGMIGGQTIDIVSKGKSLDEQTLQAMHFGKTAALMIAALEIGCIAAHAPKQLFTAIGKDLGLIYQLQDDLLDGDTAHNSAEQKLARMKEQLVSKLNILPPNSQNLQRLIQKSVKL